MPRSLAVVTEQTKSPPTARAGLPGMFTAARPNGSGQPRTQPFEGRRGSQNGRLLKPATNQLDTDQPPLFGEAGGHRDRRVAGEVRRVRKAPTDIWIDSNSVDLGGTERLAVGAVLDRRERQLSAPTR